MKQKGSALSVSTLIGMQRRKFLTLISIGGIAAMTLLSFHFFAKKKIKGLVKSTLNQLKPTTKMPIEGEAISVETALNSRCTSDYDGNSQKFHWGIFDRSKKLSNEQIQKIVSLAKIPRFTDRKVQIKAERNILTFIVQNHESGFLKNCIMVESGMMQQAVGLVCASLGIGMVFRNLGKDGKSLSDTEYGTIKIKLGPMKPAYDGTFWSNLPPAGVNPWVRGNLPGPNRDGDKPLISTLSNLKIANKDRLILKMYVNTISYKVYFLKLSPFLEQIGPIQGLL